MIRKIRLATGVEVPVAIASDGSDAELAEVFAGAPVEHAPVLEAHLPLDLDAVILLDVLEHTATPRQDLETVARSLRPGGGLMLKTFYDEFHDGKELDLTPEGDRHRSVERSGHFCPLSHIAHFDEGVLLRLIQKTGFEIVEIVRNENCGQVCVYARRST